MNNLTDMLKGISASDLQKGLKAAGEFLKSEEGKKLKSQLEGKTITEALGSTDFSALNVDDTKRKQLLNEMEKNPGLIDNLRKNIK